MNIKTVTVIGANGTMGSNVAGIFASFGNAKVFMVCRNLEDAKEAKIKSIMSVKGEAIEQKLIPMTYSDLKECIANSDLIFESVSEDIDVKKEVYENIVEYIQPHTIIGTGTSGLSINELCNFFDTELRRNYFGIHMFNPPYNMTLCEVIPSKYSDKFLLEKLKIYLDLTLNRSVVEIKDGAAFMGNRIGFQFINEAMQYAERYMDKGGIDYIDSILGPFTGRSMPPLKTSDFVGLDVHKAIVDNIYQNTNDCMHDTFVMPEFALKLISEKKLGKKTGCGLYQLRESPSGFDVRYVYDIATETYRPERKYIFPFSEQIIKELQVGNYTKALESLVSNQSVEATICLQLLLKYVIYGLIMAKSIGDNMHSADIVMATGFNWAPPLAIVDAFGGVEAFKKIVLDSLSEEFLSLLDIDGIFKDIPESRYDFRPFFKAK